MTEVDGLVLSQLEFDLLWDDLGLGAQPYPLGVPSHGYTMDEREDLGGEVFESLNAAGLIDGEEISPELEELLATLNSPAISVDALLLGEVPLRLLAAAGPRQAVLAVLDSEELALRRIFPVQQLLPVVADVLGAAPAGPGQEVRLPREVFAESLRTFAESGHSGFEWTLAQAGITGRAVRALWTLAESPRVCSGQLAANGPRGRSQVVTWFDTEAGRYGVTTQGRAGKQWVTVTPADGAWLATRLTELADQVR
ncbi:ESX secretion-associated protein EspG [Amycolatopsis acidicola]|uniref:ESX secretion-associated protein EspG n=1 Tax=Amycolatopsis acidicola TaxID=2596893 RepID=A0A5N0UI71_9PSEU|nr:ESX secretion-associated protein EspG [Amycolatopsis acidicola]KAA9148160.1 ESX secretion-associated protein EspG [Amycolatopsis acidicola]